MIWGGVLSMVNGIALERRIQGVGRRIARGIARSNAQMYCPSGNARAVKRIEALRQLVFEQLPVSALSRRISTRYTSESPLASDALQRMVTYPLLYCKVALPPDSRESVAAFDLLWPTAGSVKVVGEPDALTLRSSDCCWGLPVIEWRDFDLLNAGRDVPGQERNVDRTELGRLLCSSRSERQAILQKARRRRFDGAPLVTQIDFAPGAPAILRVIHIAASRFQPDRSPALVDVTCALPQ